MRGTLLMIGLAAHLLAGISQPVKTDSGLITGVATASPGIVAFKGIPYAAPPTGEFRWRAPRPAAKWDGVRAMDQFQSPCVQPKRAAPGEFAGSEDCLYLNVWTPAKAASEKLPVMVWVHGGGFRDGTGSMPLYDGEQFARKGVVLVTLNYRLGVIGFLSHPELSRESGHGSGNYGLLDSIAALQWVRRNIAAFGGDPAKVTLFGQSAGSMAVNCIQASPLARGLFRAVIGQSGASFYGMLNNGALAEAERKGEKFASAAGAKSLSELRSKPAAELLRTAFSAGPNTDGYVLPEDPLAIFEKGTQNRVPVLAGSNSDEGKLFARGTTTLQAYLADARKRFGPAADEYLKLYPATTDAQANESRQRAATVERMGYNARVWAELTAKSGHKSYVYYLTRITPNDPKAPPVTGLVLGSPHGEDLGYVFNNLNDPAKYKASNTFRDSLPGEYDLKLAEMVQSYWVNFAKTLDPNGPGLPRWDAFHPKQPGMVMELGDKTGMRAHPDDAGTVFFGKHHPELAQ